MAVIEVRRRADGKHYPVAPLPEAERQRVLGLAHALHCGRKLSYRQVQTVLLAQHGIRRSLGQLHNDMHDFSCDLCADQPTRPPRQRERGYGPRATRIIDAQRAQIKALTEALRILTGTDNLSRRIDDAHRPQRIDR